jgi:hypothetical protein
MRRPRSTFVVLIAVVAASLTFAGPARSQPGHAPPGEGVLQAGVAAEPCARTLCAGAASVDTTWHTGSGQGQLGGTGSGLTSGKYDPFHHSTKMLPTDGIQSRTFSKAIVVQDGAGNKVAAVKTDLYLQQDLMTRRVAELVTGSDPAVTEYAVEGLAAEGIMLAGTHNHSVPHHTSTAWGVWVFADALDYRAFDHTARRIAQSIKEADEALQPARVGAAVTRYRDIQQNIIGPGAADDGTPSGFPRDHFDDELSVVRFEAVDDGTPIAALVNFAMHPESIGGNANLISADFTGVVEREVERALGRPPGAGEGPVVVWTQGGLGDVEPDSSRANAPTERREYWRRDFAQAERMALELAAATLRTWQAVTADGEGPAVDELVEGKRVALSDAAPVRFRSYRFPGPTAHPSHTVSNCRTEQPGVPVAGFPDCVRQGEIPGWGATVQRLREAGIPVPANYGVPSYGSVQEAATVHLQVIQIGEVLLGACPCEPVTDMALNFKTRADRETGNMYLGWNAQCDDRGEEGVFCEFPGDAWQTPQVRRVDRDAYERMRAQVNNPADGWEDDPATLFGQAEPFEPGDIYGNFTHAELGEEGFTLPLMVGTANDYVGYVVTYREFQRGDHYRKALTPLGPHSADFINTRLVKMAAELRGGDDARSVRERALGGIESTAQRGKAVIFGNAAAGGAAGYETAIPDDGGTPGRIVSEPAMVVERFSAALFRWEGGSNYTDNPTVVVERLEEGAWVAAATQEGGEVVVTLDYGSPSPQAALNWLSGGYTYTWTATFEAFDRTEPGAYRFVVDGHHRRGRQANPYGVVSRPFEVRPWTGIQVGDIQVTDGSVSLVVGGHGAENPPGPHTIPADHIRYPFTYASPVPFIATAMSDMAGYRYCWRCSFRPWAPHGKVTQVLVTAGGNTAQAAIVGGRWVADLDVPEGTAVQVRVVDEFGSTNG